MRMLREFIPVRCRVFGQGGQTIALFAIMLPVLLGVAALAIEVGYIYLSKNEMQISADAAALASVRELVADDFSGARAQAEKVASANTVAGRKVVLNGARDVEFGRWENDAFTVTQAGANAVRVTIREFEGAPDGGLPLYIAPMIGVNSFKVEASAVATLANIDLVLVLDRSGSMDDDTVRRWRCCWWQYIIGGLQPMDQMRDAAKSFIGDLDSEVDRVGVVSYSSSARQEQTLTNNFHGAMKAIGNVPNPSGWTNIGDGLDKAIQELKSSRVRGSTVKVIILLSDGVPTCRPNGRCGGRYYIVSAGKEYALEKAEEAKSNNFIIHTISLGTGPDRPLMQDIASRADGSEFFAATGASLSQVFENIRKRIPVRLAS